MPFPISENEVLKTEGRIGAKLPQDYRSAMMDSNGGCVETYDDYWSLFPLDDRSSPKLISRTSNHVLRETAEAKKWPNYHENALAIAENGAGDYLVIFQKGPEFELGIFAWLHEDGSLVTVAQHFSELAKV